MAVAAAEVGAKELLHLWGKGPIKGISAKSRADWVSDADRASEAAILNYLARETPEFEVLTEEIGLIAGSSPASHRWIIDPLDGTTNYIRGLPCWAVSVALEEKSKRVSSWGKIVAGAVVVPPLGETFAAQAGSGAYSNGAALTPATPRIMSDSLLATGFPFRKRELLPQYFDLFRDIFEVCGDVRRPGAVAVDLCYTAAGIYDGFWELDLGPWDIAAGALIIAEAEGLVSDFQGGETFLSSGDIIAGSPAIQRQIVSLAKKQFPRPREVEKMPK